MKRRSPFTLYDNKPEKPKQFKSIVSEVKKLGYYAFCIDLNKGKKEIHFWISKNKKIKNHDILELIFHEMVHAYGIRSEKTATKYAEIASVSYRIITKQMKDYLR